MGKRVTSLPTHANAVVYSEKAWAVARHASTDGLDRWFVDPGAHRKHHGMPAEELLAWVDDWVTLR